MSLVMTPPVVSIPRNRVSQEQPGDETKSTHGKGANVNEKETGTTLFTGKNTALNGSTVGNSLIRVDTL